MSNVTSFQPGGTAYLQAWGTKSGIGDAPHIDIRNPATSDTLYSIGKNWVNEQDNRVWVLTSLQAFNGAVVATWVETTGSSEFDSITGNSGGAVSADVNGNINLIGAAGVTVTGTPGSNQLTVTASSSSITWTDQAGSFSALSDNGYFVTGAATVTLPASPAQGDIISIAVETGSLVTVRAVGTQTIRVANTASSAAGLANSTAIGCSLQLIYKNVGTEWFSIGSEGSWELI